MTESNFHAICDLLQDIAKTDIDQAYSILSEYTPMVKRTGNKAWVHILLMGWAKARESLTNFPEAEQLYAAARSNAAGDARHYDEALVGTVLLYAEWGKPDSLDKYVRVGKAAAGSAGDKENLSFLYTFGAMAQVADTAAMGRDLRTAMTLARDLPNRNALFTARYNYSSIYCRNNPQLQVSILQSLLELARDSTLTHKYKLYERTAFSFRNPGPNIYLQLMQVNLLLADYDNAGKFGELLFDAVVKPNPAAPQAPFFTSELALVKAWQGEYGEARRYLEESRRLFKVPEEKITYPSYFLAAGMIAEQEGREEQALQDYSVAYHIGGMEGLHLMPSELYYAHALIRAKRLDEAGHILEQARGQLPARTYTAYGYYFYKAYSELLKVKGDDAAYGKALEQYYSIKDSLLNLNHYRAIEEIEARVRLRDKEQQIVRLNEEQAERIANQRRERIFYAVLFCLAVILLVLLVGYSRNLYRRRRQAEEIARQREVLQEQRISEMEKQHRIQVMQGAIDAEQRERHKIADQLHDEVGGLLSLATLNLSSALEKERENDKGKQQLEQAQDTLLTVSTTIRELSHRLTPLMIEKYGFRRAIEDMVHAVNVSQKLSLEAVIVGFDDTTAYSGALLNELYRMIQELVQNILKHAQATQALLEVVEHPSQVSILVEDDGKGIYEGETAKGRGLDTIRSKIAYLNGRIEIGRKKEKGTLIVMEIPVENVNPGSDAFKNTHSR